MNHNSYTLVAADFNLHLFKNTQAKACDYLFFMHTKAYSYRFFYKRIIQEIANNGD